MPRLHGIYSAAAEAAKPDVVGLGGGAREAVVLVSG